ncbi:BamA/TamA family outer membrane protein [candidate division KSB1 bacterium]|nr:BamA/TamA family outer membrane protein [candidate division KSB1 bacterium]
MKSPRRVGLLVLLSLLVAGVAHGAITVRELKIDGLHRTREWVVLRELEFAVGDTVAEAQLVQARNRLNNLVIFNDVSIAADSAGRVRVSVTESWPYIPIVSVAFTEGRPADVRGVQDFFERAAVMLGGLDLNFRGAASRIWLMTEFGTNTGVTGGYATRWLSPRLPIATELFFQSLKISDRHSAVLDSSRSLRDNRIGVSVATRQGARSRVGSELRYQHVIQDTDLPAEGKTDYTVWCSPFAVLDRRDLEWYPARGAYARALTNLVVGTADFVRTSAELRGYWAAPGMWPLRDEHRPPVIALRATGGTATNSTPAWSHYYSGFNRGFRGYRTSKAEAANYLSGEAEFRFPLLRESTYSLPAFGSYGKRLPWGVSGLIAAEGFELQLDGTRVDGFAAAVGLLVRAPYVHVVEASWEINRDGETSLSLEAGIRF